MFHNNKVQFFLMIFAFLKLGIKVKEVILLVMLVRSFYEKETFFLRFIYINRKIIIMMIIIINSIYLASEYPISSSFLYFLFIVIFLITQSKVAFAVYIFIMKLMVNNLYY
jgi:hypothetical protein